MRYLMVLILTITLIFALSAVSFAFDTALFVANNGVSFETELPTLGENIIVYVGTPQIGFGLAKINYLTDNNYTFLGVGFNRNGLLNVRASYGSKLNIPLDNFFLKDYNIEGRIGYEFDNKGSSIIFGFAIGL